MAKLEHYIAVGQKKLRCGYTTGTCAAAAARGAAEALLTGVETRSSSPVRLLRGEDLSSPVRGIYPCGEGGGWAGGIMSAAVDGIRVAERIAVPSKG